MDLEYVYFRFRSSKIEERDVELADLRAKNMEDGKLYTVLMAKVERSRAINKAILNRIPGECVNIFSDDTIHIKRARVYDEAGLRRKISQLDDDPRNTAGLERLLTIKIGAVVMLRRNLDIAKGLCNGTTGTVEKIFRHQNKQENESGF